MDDSRYIRFDRHINNNDEVIDAEHINELQETSERSQRDVYKLRDYDFLDKALFTLENHRQVNGLWADMFQDTSKIDMSRTRFLEYSSDEQSVKFDPTSLSTDTYLFSKTYVNKNQANLNKVIVMADMYLPEGTDILIEVSNNAADWFPVPLGSSEPFEIPSNGYQLQMRANFSRAGDPDVTPHLFAWAMLYYDPSNNTLKMPDGSDIIIGSPDDEWDGTINLFHNQLKGIGPDDHHPQQHSHDGLDGSGVISHQVLIDIGEDDHHDKDHRHGQDGVDYVHLDEDVIGKLATDHLSYMVWTGKPGDTGLYFDPAFDDKLVYVKTPDDETYLFYDLTSGRLTHTITIIQGIAVWETLIYGKYTNSKGVVDVILKGTEKVHYDATDKLVQDEISKLSAPPVVQGLVVTDLGTGTTAKLTWAKNPAFDLDGYNVYMSINGGYTYTQVNAALVVGEDYVVSTLSAGTSYKFYVTAVDIDKKESDPSEVKELTPSGRDITPPARVAGISTDLTNGEVRVFWSDNVEPDLDHYNVYRSDSGASSTFAVITSIAPSDPTFIDTTLTTGDDYYYYVTAVDTSGNEGIPSNIISVVAP